MAAGDGLGDMYPRIIPRLSVRDHTQPAFLYGQLEHIRGQLRRPVLSVRSVAAFSCATTQAAYAATVELDGR
jgi:hypothetical protein